MSKALIKLRPEPKNPKQRPRVQRTFPLEDGNHTLQEVIDWAKSWGVSAEEVYFYEEVTHDRYDEYTTVEQWFEIHVPETDEEFAARSIPYKKRLDKYTAWYNKNEELIKAELVRQAEVKKTRAEKRKEKAKADLVKEKKRLEKRLASVTEELK